MDDHHLVIISRRCKRISHYMSDSSRCKDYESIMHSEGTAGLGITYQVSDSDRHEIIKSLINEPMQNWMANVSSFHSLSMLAKRLYDFQEELTLQCPWTLALKKVEERREWQKIANELSVAYQKWSSHATRKIHSKQILASLLNNPATGDINDSEQCLPLKTKYSSAHIQSTINGELETQKKQEEPLEDAVSVGIKISNEGSGSNERYERQVHSHGSRIENVVNEKVFVRADNPVTPQSKIKKQTYSESASVTPQTTRSIVSLEVCSDTPYTPTSILGSERNIGLDTRDRSSNESTANNSDVPIFKLPEVQSKKTPSRLLSLDIDTNFTKPITASQISPLQEDVFYIGGHTLISDQELPVTSEPLLKPAVLLKRKELTQSIKRTRFSNRRAQNTVLTSTLLQETFFPSAQSSPQRHRDSVSIASGVDAPQVEELESFPSLSLPTVVISNVNWSSQRTFFAPSRPASELVNQVHELQLENALRLYDNAIGSNTWSRFNELCTELKDDAKTRREGADCEASQTFLKCFSITSKGKYCNIGLKSGKERIELAIKSLEDSDYVSDANSSYAHANKLATLTLCTTKNKQDHQANKTRILSKFKNNVIFATPEAHRSPALWPLIPESMEISPSYVWGGFEAWPPDPTEYKSMSAALREAITKKLHEKSREKIGYVYIFHFHGVFGFIKIGLAHKIEERMKQLKGRCGLEPEVLPGAYRAVPVPNVARVEKLVHTELAEVRYKWVNCRCKTNHNEWFKAPHGTAKEVVHKWIKWMLTEPYDEDGNLKAGVLDGPDTPDSAKVTTQTSIPSITGGPSIEQAEKELEERLNNLSVE